MSGVDLSVVVPVYGCASCLRELHRRLRATLASAGGTHELLFVDDRSPDASWQVLRELAAADPAVRVIRLSRNFGQHAAITAGLAYSEGARVVVMDCDLQDPPEDIPRLLARADEGFEIVFARRMRKQHSWIRRSASALFFRFVNATAARQLNGEYGSFSVISRRVVDAFLRLGDRERHYLFVLNWLGFNSADVEYQHGARHSGESSYTLRALLRHALSGIFFQTTVLLRWIVYLGFWVSFSGVALAAWFVYQYFARDVLPGYTSLAVLILLLGGFIISSTGITGLYIGRIFEQVKQRPLFVVDREIRGGREL